MRYYLSAVLCVCLVCKLHAKNHYSDSLKRLIDEQKVFGIEKVNTLLLLAKYYQQTVSKYDSSRVVLDDAIAEANRIKATELLIDATFNKGVLLYYSFENRAEGSLLYQKSYELAIKYDHPNKLSRIFYGLGIANDHIKDHRATEDYFLKAYDYAVKFNNDIDKSKAIRALGAFYKARENPEKVQQYTDELKELLGRSEDPVVLANGWSFISAMYVETGELHDACAAKEKSLMSQRKTNNKIDISTDLLQLADLCWKIHNTERIKELAQEIFEFKGISNYLIQGNVASLSKLLSNVYALEGDFRNAYKFEKMSNDINIKIADLKLTDKLTEAQVRFESIQKDKEIRFQLENLAYRNRIILILVGFAITILIALVVIFRNSKKRLLLSQQLFEKNGLLELQKSEIERQREELAVSNSKLADLNNNLDTLVQQKTLELVVKNKKLIDYSFLNAHSLRGPLARILGLVNLIRLQDQGADINSLIDMLDVSSKELDKVIHKINKIVESDELMKR